MPGRLVAVFLALEQAGFLSAMVECICGFFVSIFSTVLLLYSLDATARWGKVGIVGKVFSKRTHLAHLINAELLNLARN
jgi:hypothetical protein